MNEQSRSSSFDPNSVRKVVNVNAPQSIAWDVFTQQMGTWWPLAVYKIGNANAVDAVMEPRVGGRWYERGEDGSTCDWGRVLAWEPPHRVVLSWQLDGAWEYDPDPAHATEVEVRFVAEGPSTTRVELVHSKFDRARSGAQLRVGVGNDNGWNGLLRRFEAAVDGRDLPAI